MSASGDVRVNGAPALRVGDVGIHATCCTTNTWQVTSGSGQVFVNGKPLVRQGDATRHCGGVGKMMEASGNVFDGSAGLELREQIAEWLQRVQSDGLQELLAMLHYPAGAAYFPIDEANKLTDPDCQGTEYFEHLAKCLPGSPPDPPRGPRPPYDPPIEPVGFFDLDNPITGIALLPVPVVRGAGLVVKGGGALAKGGAGLVRGAVEGAAEGLGEGASALGGLVGL